jgi:integrase/recombinase XerD
VRFFMYQNTSLETTVKEGTFGQNGASKRVDLWMPQGQVEEKKEGQNSLKSRPVITISQAMPGFLRYAQFELCLAEQTVKKYKDILRWIAEDLGDIPVEEIDLAHVTLLKQKNYSRGAGESRLITVVFGLKSFLRYCGGILGIPTMPLGQIRSPKRTRREVLFLSNEEVNQFIQSIKIGNINPQKNKGTPEIRIDGLRFRTLVEVLLGTGVRISEALSLKKDMIDFEKGEAKIVGKGNKERTAFFSSRALQWIKHYLDVRNDDVPWLFVTQRGTPLNRADVSGLFRRYSKKAGLDKKVTPHILRHTTATNLLFNGCPISHVKEILGHSRLETTCRYYLGIDKSKAKEAHNTFLKF